MRTPFCLVLLFVRSSALHHIEKFSVNTARGGGSHNVEKVQKSASSNIFTEALAGTTVALASIPSAIAYSAIAGVSPLVGVWSSVVLGAIGAVTGLRPGLIAGCAGVVAVPLAAVIAQSPDYIAPTILLAAALELIFSLLRGGQLISLVSDPVMNGFMNGLGLLFVKSQFKVFVKAGKFLPARELAFTVGVTALTASLAVGLPKILPKECPAALLAIVASTIVAEVFNMPVVRLSLGGAITSWKDTLPTFAGLPKFNGSILKIIAPAAFSIALISILETLLAVKVVDDATDTTVEGAFDNSCQAMAIGNAASALLGGFGGCGLIPHSLLNISSGGTKITSVLVYATVMALSIVFTSSLLTKVPTAAFAGVMLLVAMKTITWEPSIEALKLVFQKQTKGKKLFAPTTVNLLSLIVTTALCFKVDMGTGIIVGVLLDKILSRL